MNFPLYPSSSIHLTGEKINIRARENGLQVRSVKSIDKMSKLPKNPFFMGHL